MDKVPASLWAHFIVFVVQNCHADINVRVRLGCHEKTWKRWLKGDPISFKYQLKILNMFYDKRFCKMAGIFPKEIEKWNVTK